MSPPDVYFSVSSDGRRVAEALIADPDPSSGLIDAPGVVPAYRTDLSGYEALLVAALARVDAPEVAVESWGEGPERLAVCERLGLTTAEYTPGWEFVLGDDPSGPRAHS